MTPSTWFLLLSTAVSAAKGPYNGNFDTTHLLAREGCPRLNPYVKDGTLIDRLWRGNCDLVYSFLYNDFSVAQAELPTSETLGSFQYYSVQDYYYLLETVPNKALLMKTLPPSSEEKLISIIETTIESMIKSLQDAASFRQSLIDRLNVTDQDISSGSFQVAGLGYVKWLQENTNLGWFAFQVSMIPCIYGWAELANRLDRSSKTNKSTTFYEEWIKPNSEWSYGRDLSEKLEMAQSSYNIDANFDVYNRLFRQGMSFEIAFFESALGRSLSNAKGGDF